MVDRTVGEAWQREYFPSYRNMQFAAVISTKRITMMHSTAVSVRSETGGWGGAGGGWDHVNGMGFLGEGGGGEGGEKC